MKFSGGTAQKIDDLIIEFVFDKDVEIDQQMSIEVLSIIMNLSEGKPHGVLYNFNTQNIMLSEIARKFSGARNFRNSKMVARAIATNSLSSTLEVNHYINKTNPAADTMIFKSREDAIAWLHEKAKTFVARTDASSEFEL